MVLCGLIEKNVTLFFDEIEANFGDLLFSKIINNCCLVAEKILGEL